MTHSMKRWVFAGAVALVVLLIVSGVALADNSDRSNEMPDDYILSSVTVSHDGAITPIYTFAEAAPSIPPLKWPLSGTLSDRTTTLDFGADWKFGACPAGVYKKHVGIDVTATKGEDVYAAEGGEVKAKVYDGTWKYCITIEHSGFTNDFTTVCWHIDPVVTVGDHVTKGQKIGTIADLGTNTHLHFGVRNSGYSNIANRGALPQTDCGGDPAFPEHFIDPKTITYEGVEDPFNYQGEYVIDRTKLSDSEKNALSHVQKYAKEQMVSPALLMAIIKQESNFDSNAIGDGGLAIGYMQLHWDAAYDAGYRSARGDSTDYAREDWPTDGLDPDTNIKYGCGYLKICYDMHKDSPVYDDSLKNAISAYNLGCTHGPDKSNENSYVKPILGYYEEYKGKYIASFSLDLIFAIDTTGSMWDDIDNVKASASAIVDDVLSDIPGARIAVVDYRDFPVDPYGDPGDYEFNDVLSFSTDKPTIVAAIQGLNVDGGNDWRESVYSALMHSIDSTSLGSWRGSDQAAKVIILMGDAPPHDPEPFTGYTLSSVSLAAELADPVIIYPVQIGGTVEKFEELANQTGGEAFTAENAGEVVDAILDAIEEIKTKPIAYANGPYLGYVGCPIIFDGTGSYDIDGTIVSYEWDFDDDGEFDDATGATPSKTWDSAYSGDISLKVTDNDGNEDVGSTTVTVREPATVETATGTGTAYFASDAGTIEDLAALNESDLPEENPDVDFPHGLFSFNITGLSNGATVNVTINFPQDIPTTAQYWKYNTSSGEWYQIPIGSNDGDNIITITLQDGGIGDNDGVENGIISDPGAPGVPSAPPTPPPKPIKPASVPVPAFTPPGIIALIGLLALAGLVVLRRKE